MQSTSNHSSTHTTASVHPRLIKISLALLMSGAIAVALVSSAIATLLSISVQLREEFNHNQQLILEQAKSYHQAGDHQTCIAEAIQVQHRSAAFREAQSLLADCRQNLTTLYLAQARQAAWQGEYRKAINLARQVPQSDRQIEAQQLMQEWSERILEIATGYYLDPTHRLNDAIATANAIPEFSPLYQRAQTLIQNWQTEWSNNNRSLQAAQTALNRSHLPTARHHLAQISPHPFWQNQLQPLLQTLNYLEQQQHYAQLWHTAQQLLEQGEPENAIHLARHLPDRHPWQERKTQLIERAQLKQKQIQFCQRIPFPIRFWNCY